MHSLLQDTRLHVELLGQRAGVSVINEIRPPVFQSGCIAASSEDDVRASRGSSTSLPQSGAADVDVGPSIRRAE